MSYPPNRYVIGGSVTSLAANQLAKLQVYGAPCNLRVTAKSVSVNVKEYRLHAAATFPPPRRSLT